jgi:hypothetical protein
MQKRRLHAKEKETDAHLLPPFPQRIFGNAANQGFLGLPQQLLLFYSFSLRRGWEKKNMNNYAMHTREIYLSAYPSCQILTPLYGALSIAAVVRILFISLFLSLSLLYLYLCSSSVVHAYLQSVDLARGPARENATAGTELFIECNTVCSPAINLDNWPCLGSIFAHPILNAVVVRAINRNNEMLNMTPASSLPSSLWPLVTSASQSSSCLCWSA